MDYNLLKVLIALVSTSNVTQAANLLNLSQPATSNALSRLRMAMDDPILVRTGNSMIPTDRAVKAAAEAALITVKIEQLFIPPEAFNPLTSKHRFSVALTDQGMQTVVPTLLQVLQKEAPHIELDIKILGNNDSLESISANLLRNEIDFLISRIIETPKVFNILTLFEDRFVTIASRNHSVIKKRLTEKTFLDSKHVLVSFSGDRHGIIDEALNRQQKTRTITHTVNNFFNAAFIVEKTDLLCTVSEKVAGKLTDKFNVDVFKCPIETQPFSVGVYWSRTREQNPEHAWFISLLKRMKEQLD